MDSAFAAIVQQQKASVRFQFMGEGGDGAERPIRDHQGVRVRIDQTGDLDVVPGPPPPGAGLNVLHPLLAMSLDQYRKHGSPAFCLANSSRLTLLHTRVHRPARP